jgi:hypothetical protein
MKNRAILGKNGQDFVGCLMPQKRKQGNVCFSASFGVKVPAVLSVRKNAN